MDSDNFPINGTIWDESFPEKVKDLAGKQLFEFRMLSEGRYFEYLDLVQSHVDTGKSEAAASNASRREMGYRSETAEREWYLSYLHHLSGERERINSNRVNAKARRARAVRENMAKIEEFLEYVPEKARPEVEFDWVCNHPRIIAVQQKSADKQALIDDFRLEDVKCPKYKPAPSRGAVTMLRFALEKPNEFVKHRLDMVKKHISASMKVSNEPDLVEELRDAKRTANDIENMITALTEG